VVLCDAFLSRKSHKPCPVARRDPCCRPAQRRPRPTPPNVDLAGRSTRVIDAFIAPALAPLGWSSTTTVRRCRARGKPRSSPAHAILRARTPWRRRLPPPGRRMRVDIGGDIFFDVDGDWGGNSRIGRDGIGPQLF
jgi:hypothetical protein